MSEPLDINDTGLCEALLIMGDEKAVAWAWIQGYTKNLLQEIQEYLGDTDYEYQSNVIQDEYDLMELADGHQNGNWGDYMIVGGLFEGNGVDPLFWDKYAIVRGIPREEVSANNFFSCSC